MNTEILELEEQKTADASPAEPLQQRVRFAGSLSRRWTLREPAVPALPGTGDLLVSSSLASPIELRTRPFTQEWMAVEGKRLREVERELRAVGWNCFYLIPDVHASGIARNPEQAVRKALSKAFRTAREQGVNVLEIAALTVKSWLGFHRAEVRARLRHIQASPYLFATNKEMRKRMQRVAPSVRTIRLTRGHYGREYAEYRPL